MGKAEISGEGMLEKFKTEIEQRLNDVVKEMRLPEGTIEDLNTALFLLPPKGVKEPLTILPGLISCSRRGCEYTVFKPRSGGGGWNYCKYEGLIGVNNGGMSPTLLELVDYDEANSGETEEVLRLTSTESRTVILQNPEKNVSMWGVELYITCGKGCNGDLYVSPGQDGAIATLASLAKEQ